MFGIRYAKAAPGQFLMQFRNGEIVREGAGRAFFWFAPSSTLVGVPTTAIEVPFMFEEVTRDYQSVTVQGQVSYRIAQPKLLAQQMDFTLRPDGTFASEDPQKLPLRVLNAVKAQFRGLLQELDLREVLKAGEVLAGNAKQRLARAPALTALGVEIIDLGILAAKPSPETARALEAPMREVILKEADDATYARRNAAIEQERGVRENELRSELVVMEKRQQMREQELAGNVALEQRNAELVELQASNRKLEADTQAYGVRLLADALRGLDARTLQALTMSGASPEMLMAIGFQNLADNAAKIGEVNVAPDLLRQIARKG